MKREKPNHWVGPKVHSGFSVSLLQETEPACDAGDAKGFSQRHRTDRQ